jgi:hypothetical protein
MQRKIIHKPFSSRVWVQRYEPKTMSNNGENWDFFYIFFLDISKLCYSFQVMLNY